MIIDGATAKIQMVTSASGSIDWHASWAVNTSGTVSVSSDDNNVATNATTDIVPAAGSSKQAMVLIITARNAHASVVNDVTIQHFDGAQTSTMFKATLQIGETLQYTPQEGFKVYDSTGQQKVINQALSPFTIKTLASDHSNATTTATEVTGMTQAMGVGTWVFEYFIIYRSDTTTTGIKWSCNHDGTVTFFVYNAHFVDNGGAASAAAADQDALAATAQVYSAYAARAKSTAGTMISASVDTINVDMFLKIEGIAVVTVAGNIALWHGSEVATTTLFKAGSTLRLTKVA